MSQPKFDSRILAEHQLRNLAEHRPRCDLLYDNLDRTLSAATPDQTQTFAWDALSRIISQTGVLGTVAYDYDPASRRTKMTWPDGFYVNYDWNVAGQLTAIRENGAASGVGVLARFIYDAYGRADRLNRGDGVDTSYGYDGPRMLSSIAG